MVLVKLYILKWKCCFSSSVRTFIFETPPAKPQVVRHTTSYLVANKEAQLQVMLENEENRAPNEKEPVVKENKEEENMNQKTETKPDVPENGCLGLWDWVLLIILMGVVDSLWTPGLIALVLDTNFQKERGLSSILLLI